MFTVYVIQNEKGQTYTGQTEDLENRLLRHNGRLKSKSRSFTKMNAGPWKVIYTEIYNTREEAMKREKQLKSFQGRLYIKQTISGA